MTGSRPTVERAVSVVDRELDAREARARFQLRQAADLEQEATRELDRVYWARQERALSESKDETQAMAWKRTREGSRWG